MEYGNYAKEQKKEEETFENVVDYIDVATNKKPYIEVLKYSDRTESTMKITAMARDQDGEPLTYRLFVGTTKDNLTEQTDIKEKVEQGQEVEWGVSVADKSKVYYYKVVVKDRYTTIESEIKETNNAPVLENIELEKDIDEETGNNWVKVIARATDIENDKLTYTLNMWNKEEGRNETEIIAETPTKTEKRKDITAGEEIEIQINGLEEYQDYIYRVDVADKNNITIGNIEEVKTYCSGKLQICPGYEKCKYCDGSGHCIHISVNSKKTDIKGTVACPGTKIFYINTNGASWWSITCDYCYAIVYRSERVCGSPNCIYNNQYGYCKSNTPTDSNVVMKLNAKGKNGALHYFYKNNVCNKCESGKTTKCNHGLSYEHYYCEHSGTVYTDKHD